MPISLIESQRKLREVGRIRMGDQKPTSSGKLAPNKLEAFRLTSPDRGVLEAAAALYGGTVKMWEGQPGQYELYIQTEELPCMVAPNAVDQWYELWSGGGCKRHCDGHVDTISGGPCLCDPNNRECKPTTRMWVWLHELPGFGTWRLESHGFYAALELPLQAEFLRDLAARQMYVPAALAIEQRKVVRDGKTKRFIVPVIRTKHTLQSILQQAGSMAQLAAAPTTQAVAAIAPAPDMPEAPPDPEAFEGVVVDDEVWAGPGQCPKCHAPVGKRHGKPCA